MQHWLHTRTSLYCEASDTGEGYLSQQLGDHEMYPLTNPTVSGDLLLPPKKSTLLLKLRNTASYVYYSSGRIDSMGP